MGDYMNGFAPDLTVIKLNTEMAYQNALNLKLSQGLSLKRVWMGLTDS